MGLREFLQPHIVEIVNCSEPEALATGENRTVAHASGSDKPFFAADVGITGVDFLIAETGSLVMRSSPGQPRSISLLPPVHIALAERRQIVPDLFDLFHELGNPPALPSCLTLITGPSKTGDIELRLVTGVHGPGTVHVLMVDS
jgi:L-lactate dehydrogenase complex protein LldG